MLAGDKSITLQESSDRVLAVLADVDCYPQWHPFFATVKPTGRDQQERVVTAECRHDAGLSILNTVLSFEYAERSVSARRTSGDLRSLEGVFDVAAGDTGGVTLVTHHLRVDPGMRIGLLLRGPVEARVRTRVLDGALDGLARHLAAGA